MFYWNDSQSTVIISSMAKYPIYLELGGKRVVVIGAGKVGARKAFTLHKTGAKVTVVSKRIHDNFKKMCGKLDIEVVVGKYSKEYLDGAVLAIAATDDNELNTQIYNDCQQMRVICNVVDVPRLCDFYVPAIVDRGDLQIAISTNGKSPAYAGYIRRKLEKIYTNEHTAFIEELNTIRNRVIEKIPDPKKRKEILKHIATDEAFEMYACDGAEFLHKLADELIEKAGEKSKQ
ncbi:MAG: bifunctional precorrin-2 dehydrogenase/sirohydrochlorin ferrochelatase [Anaerohalosphaera sp.]|nr:bifunctional precorrin-2 dehydrogenase/sirohydrochlorin ferrochelatase [Anaerohalosphaera sp.]